MSFLTLSAQTYPNTALGYGNLAYGDAGSRLYNVALGVFAGAGLTSGVENVAIGYEAFGGLSGSRNIAIGSSSLRYRGNDDNIAIGNRTLSDPLYTGSQNVAIGYLAGLQMSSGSKNLILGSFTGLGGGLDIRTLSNYIVLSDGDGNPRLWIDNTGAMSVPGGGSISGSLTITGGTVTASNPVLQATQTWSNAGVAFTGWRLNITDTASAAGSLLMDLQVGGASRLSLRKDGLLTVPYLSFNFSFPNHSFAPYSNGLYWNGNGNSEFGYLNNTFYIRSPNSLAWGTVQSGGDLFLARDAANTLAQRNGVNWQAFNIYSTYTDASNYERIEIRQSGASWFIGSNSLGTGPGNRNINLSANGQLVFGANGGSNWLINTSGHFLANADNTYDIGASGANRPRNIFAGTNVFAGNFVGGAQGVFATRDYPIQWSNSNTDPFSGAQTTLRSSNTASNMVCWGGITSSFPALKRRSANLQTVGADDAGTAGFIVGNQALATTATDGFIYVPSCAGVPTGVPTAYTGTIPHVVDTTNKHAYWYIAGAWWRANLV